MGRRPRVFIGSATESIRIAEALNENLIDIADVTMWNRLALPPGGHFLQHLEQLLEWFDYGVFVLTPDDGSTSRGEPRGVPRDNVILELGMFIGKLGRFRSFFVVPRDSTLRLPSDMEGIVHVAAFNYERVKSRPEEAPAELAVAATQIKRNIEPSIEDRVPVARLLRSDTEMPSEFLLRTQKSSSVIHTAILNWTVVHDQGDRDAFRDELCSRLLKNQFDLRQVVSVHHIQQYREVLGMMAAVGKSLRYGSRYIPATQPPLPLPNYWAFDLEHFFLETANYDRARSQSTLALYVTNDPHLADSVHGYFDDLWRQASSNQLANGGDVFWHKAIELGTNLAINPLTVEEATKLVDDYKGRGTDAFRWRNADLVTLNS